MIVNWVIQPLERLPVALTGDSPAPARRLALDLRQMMDEDLDDLAGRLRAAAGSAAGDALVAALEDAVLLAGGGRWTRAELAGWTITSLVHCLADHCGPAEALAQLQFILERAADHDPDGGR